MNVALPVAKGRYTLSQNFQQVDAICARMKARGDRMPRHRQSKLLRLDQDVRQENSDANKLFNWREFLFDCKKGTICSPELADYLSHHVCGWDEYVMKKRCPKSSLVADSLYWTSLDQDQPVTVKKEKEEKEEEEEDEEEEEEEKQEEQLVYSAWKEEFEKEWCQIASTRTFAKKDKVTHKITLFTRNAFMEHHGLVRLGGSKKRRRSVEHDFLRRWLKDPNLRSYLYAAVHFPPFKAPENTFNLWQETMYKPTIHQFVEDFVEYQHGQHVKEMAVSEWDMLGLYQKWCENKGIVCAFRDPTHFIQSVHAFCLAIPEAIHECPRQTTQGKSYIYRISTLFKFFHAQEKEAEDAQEKEAEDALEEEEALKSPEKAKELKSAEEAEEWEEEECCPFIQTRMYWIDTADICCYFPAEPISACFPSFAPPRANRLQSLSSHHLFVAATLRPVDP